MDNCIQKRRVEGRVWWVKSKRQDFRLVVFSVALIRSPLEIDLAVFSVLLVHKPVFFHKSRVRERCKEVRKVKEGERVPRTEPPNTREATGVASWK